jgi:hypothetical protein
MSACRRQIEAVWGRAPLVVGPERASSYSGSKLDRFRKIEQLSDLGLEGFWRYACERFFVLEELMAEVGLDRCIHLESDNLLYAPPAPLAPWLRDVYGESVTVCPLTDTEDTAAVMYVGSRAALSRFTQGLLDLVELGPDGLQAEHGEGVPHEMKMLHILRTKLGLCEALPIKVGEARALHASYVFDPGSYGQLVDGTVFEPGIPYVGDHQLIGRDLAAGRARLVWDAGRERPLLYSAPEDHLFMPLANLHVHSKRLDEVLSGRHRLPPPPPPSFAVRLRSTLDGGRARTNRLVHSLLRR